MKNLVADKITLLNQTTLESLNEPNKVKIVENFTKVGIQILGADFGFGWLKSTRSRNYKLAYKSPGTPYNPNPPRERGGNYKAQKYKTPFFKEVVRSIDYAKEYDVSAYMQSYVIIPVNYKNSIYGNVVLCFKRPHQFTEEERSLCLALGNAAAQAITINRLYSNLKDFKNTLDGTLDSIIMFDPASLKVIYANEGAVHLRGNSKKELSQRSFYELQDSFTPRTFAPVLKSLSEGKVKSELFETRLLRGRKKKIPVEFFLQYIKAKNQPPRLLSIIRDISERKKDQESIWYNAYHDTLTGLPNRIYFTEEFSKTLQATELEKGKLAVLFADLDRFKFINDVLGHIIGDQLLAQVARRLQSCVHRDDVVSRMGGDEFVVLLRNIDEEASSINIAKRILEAFKKPFTIDEQEIFVNMSIGISVYPLDGKDINTLMKNADSALQRAKERGGSSYQQYHAGITIPDKMHMELEKQLRKALEQEELVIHYQPQVDTITNSITSCEALVRWEHPELGLIYPDQFIGYAEDSGLIIPMGEWILRRACFQAQSWNNAGLPPLTLAVNLSPRQLLHQNFVDTVARILKETHLSPSLLELEITERLIMKNIDVAIDILKQFKAMGIRLSVDDFGTGYASLSYLRRLPVDLIKIDRSFIHGSLANIQDAAIITAMITIAHQLGLKVVAEGVETKKQQEFLRSQRCDFIQGNLYSKPLPPHEFQELFANRTAQLRGLGRKGKQRS